MKTGAGNAPTFMTSHLIHLQICSRKVLLFATKKEVLMKQKMK